MTEQDVIDSLGMHAAAVAVLGGLGYAWVGGEWVTAQDMPLTGGPRGLKPLAWTADRKPDHECHYDHCIAETPFGRFLLTWKGWEDYPAYTADETPWNEWAGTWGTLGEAQRACEAEFARRLTMCLAAQPETIAAERERCAKLCDAQFWIVTRQRGGDAAVTAGECAAAIRSPTVGVEPVTPATEER